MKELQTFVRRGRVVPVFLGSAGGGDSFQEVNDGKEAAIIDKVWLQFEHYVRSEREYLEAVSAAFTGVRLESCNRYWNLCIQRIRTEVLRLLGKQDGGLRLTEEELLVGQHEHLLNLEALLGLSSHKASEDMAMSGSAAKEVGIIGVKGMGGVGKSTLAKALHDSSDVREWFGGNICWLVVGPYASEETICRLQKQILQQICDTNETIYNHDQGRALIRLRMQGKKVLIFLDDVWDDIDLAAAIVRKEDLSSGSRILKTSRVREAIGGYAYDLDVLGLEAGWELFCWHAFGGNTPPKNLLKRCRLTLHRCGGLPLAIKV